MKRYLPRIADSILREKLEALGAVLITGAKWCGKSSTGEHASASTVRMDDPSQEEQNLRMAKIEPLRLLEGATPRLIDEWQLAPKLWDAVRYEVDRRDEAGQFILTGSAVPPNRDEVHHSGTGRITRMRMRPMSLWESGESNGQVSLSSLFAGQHDLSATADIDLDGLAFLIARGGWPRAVTSSPSAALQLAPAYLEAIVQEDISRVDGVSRNTALAQKILRSYTRSIGAAGRISQIAGDIGSNGSCGPSIPTVSSYMTALREIFVLEPSPCWNTNLRSRTAIRSADTFYFTDPSIGVAALDIGPNDLINDLKTMGLFFENLAVRDLRVYTEALGGSVFHYRDKTGMEVDAVLHLRNGRYALVEIKLGGTGAIDQGAASLTKMVSKIDVSKVGQPAFLMVLTGVGRYAYRRPDDGVLVVPIGALGR